MTYQPIENHGAIGDMQTMALVDLNGAIDWFCYPWFDSPSLFAALLDHKKGGVFYVQPLQDGATVRQTYIEDTNVLVTEFSSDRGTCELMDFMPPDSEPHSCIMRLVKCTNGQMRLRMRCAPAFNFARDEHRARHWKCGVEFNSRALSVRLASSTPLAIDSQMHAFTDFDLAAGEVAAFELSGTDNPPCDLDIDALQSALASTVAFWRKWLRPVTYRGPYQNAVRRSALLLKLLTFRPTGAILAAPTCSLPEAIGGERNWDYRYSWIRDAAMTLQSLMRLGFHSETTAYLKWLRARFDPSTSDLPLQIMYGLRGERQLTEATLEHLEGYRGSRPVRIGNAAHGQLQLDIVGELLDMVELYDGTFQALPQQSWRHLCRLLDWVCDHWREKDDSIWEVRGGRQHFVLSKVMCWVALDRGVRMAARREISPPARWVRAARDIREHVEQHGWNAKRKAFVQHFGSEELDAANFLIALTGFLEPHDSRVLSTLKASQRLAIQGGLMRDGLVLRYDPEVAPDGLAGDEGSFNICSFWLVETLARSGQQDDAVELFERLLHLGNHLGLYSEEVSNTGEALGNFPQAFSHLGLINAALALAPD